MREIENMVKKIMGAQKDLNKCEKGADEVEEQETLLGLEVSTRHLSQLKDIKTALEPIDKLWMNAHEYMQLAATWNQVGRYGGKEGDS